MTTLSKNAINPFTGEPYEEASFPIELYQKRDERKKFLSESDAPTPTEMIVLNYLRDGMSSLEIAGKMYVSPRTIESHIGNLLNKNNCKSRLGLIVHLVKEGKIEPIRADKEVAADRISHLEQRLTILEKQRNEMSDQLREARISFSQSIDKILQQLDAEDFA